MNVVNVLQCIYTLKSAWDIACLGVVFKRKLVAFSFTFVWKAGCCTIPYILI